MKHKILCSGYASNKREVIYNDTKLIFGCDGCTCIHLAVWLLIWEVTRLKLLVLVFLDDDNLMRFLKTLDAISQTLNSITQLNYQINESHGRWRNRKSYSMFFLYWNPHLPYEKQHKSVTECSWSDRANSHYSNGLSHVFWPINNKICISSYGFFTSSTPQFPRAPAPFSKMIISFYRGGVVQ